MDTRPQLPFGSVLRASRAAGRLKWSRDATGRFNGGRSGSRSVPSFQRSALDATSCLSGSRFKASAGNFFPQQLRGASPLDFSVFNISSNGNKRIKRTDGNARLSFKRQQHYSEGKKKKRKINPPLNIQLLASPLNNLFSHVQSRLTFM